MTAKDIKYIGNSNVSMFPFYYKGDPVRAYVEFSDGTSEIRNVVMVLDGNTGLPIEYNNRGIRSKIHRELKQTE